MRVHRLDRRQWIPASLERVFDFFSRAENLARITPPWLGFRILTPLPVPMRRGARLEYRIRLGPLPLRWLTRIEVWDPPRAFVDVQERGPYALWEHAHRFEPEAGGVWMTDRVRYALPLGPAGRLANRLAVARVVRAIFDYRSEQIRVDFAAEPAAAGEHAPAPR